MAHKIQIKRGNKADLPTLDDGEFGLCQDTAELFIGNSGNVKVFPTMPEQISADIVTDGVTNKAYTATEKTKLAGIANNANNYSHPTSHPASMITGLPTTLPANGGSASTTTKLQTARKINGVSFDGTADITVADATKEPAFTKNTAFNKNFGTASGTVCQGNDARLSNARTPVTHTHTKSQITDMPTKLSQLTNDIGAGAELVIITSATEPTLSVGDQWHREY